MSVLPLFLRGVTGVNVVDTCLAILVKPLYSSHSHAFHQAVPEMKSLAYEVLGVVTTKGLLECPVFLFFCILFGKSTVY